MSSSNNIFSKTVDELKIPNISNYKLDNTNDPLKEALRYFKNHPSIANAKSKGFDASFTFRDTSSGEVINLIKTLNLKEASQKTDITARIVKFKDWSFLNYICKTFSHCIRKGEFPCVLEDADVVPVHKPVHKKEISDKANYGPINILPNLYKFMKN